MTQFLPTRARPLICAAIAVLTLAAEAHAAGVHFIELDAVTLPENLGYDSRSDSPLNATSNSLSSSVDSIVNVTQFDGTPATFHLTGSSFAAADLASGSLRAFATGTEFRGQTNAVIQGNAGAILVDTLTFNLPNKATADATDITFNFHLNGTISGASGDQSDMGFEGIVCDPSIFLSFSRCSQFDHNVELNTAVPVQDSNAGWDAFTVASPNQVSGDFTGTFKVTGNNPVLMIEMRLGVGITGLSTSDFGDTGFVNITVPDGGTFTSDSGVFLSNPVSETTSSIPEPATLLLLGVGLVGLSAIRRRRSSMWVQQVWLRAGAPTVLATILGALVPATSHAAASGTLDCVSVASSSVSTPQECYNSLLGGQPFLPSVKMNLPSDNDPVAQASSFAASDLPRASVRASVSAISTGIINGEFGDVSFANAQAALGDQLTFHGIAAGHSAIITVHFVLEGTAFNDTSSASQSQNTFSLSIGTANGDLIRQVFHQGVFLSGALFDNENTASGNWLSATFVSPSATTLDFVGSFAISADDPVIDIGESLFLDVTANATLDYADTGFIDLEPQAGITFTSESGVFLNNPAGGTTSSVPEPTTLALLGAGLVGLSAIRHRRSSMSVQRGKSAASQNLRGA